MYDFRISPLYYPTENQSREFFHPKFIRDRPDLLHEIKRKAFEPHCSPAMKEKVEFLGDLGHVPAQLGAMQDEDMRTWDNPSKIINKYLLDQVSDAKIALTHDRDWSYVAKMGLSYLDSSKLIEEVAFQNNVIVENGIVFLELKNGISLVEERAIIDQMEGGQITVEQYLFGSSDDRSTVLSYLINELRSVHTPKRHRYTMRDRETLMGHPKRLLSLDDLMGIHGEKSLLQRRHIDSVRSELNALPPQHPDKGIWLLRLADALSRRFWQLNQKDDLEEAIWYYEEAVSLLSQTHYHFLEAILGLCSSVYHRFRLLGQLEDLKKLLDRLHAERNLNFESLISPVKAQLQERPQQLINRFSDPLPVVMMNEGTPSQARKRLEPQSRRSQRKTTGNTDAKVESPKDVKTTTDPLDLRLWGL
ncbi:hypothetical protein BYT27DRAFT_7197341 [Phlegmacium glaucopus]|nr:hypothetical protein BYT27DRAFT_7197341 [Phlegmacium glaucopus]